MSKKLTVGIATCILSLGITGLSSANWTAQSTMTVPGGNSSAFGDKQDVSWNTKDRTDSQASFYTYSRSSYNGMDARIVNSDNASRSNWARNMNKGDNLFVSTTASQNYKYNVEISSNLAQVGNDTISFTYSPDKESSK